MTSVGEIENKMYEYNAKIIRVVDGDTCIALIDLGFNCNYKCTLRLYCIDSPETRTRDLEEKKEGFAAKERLIELFEKSNYDVKLKSHGVGKYGRCLAELQITSKAGQHININQTLLAEGLAEEYKG